MYLAISIFLAVVFLSASLYWVSMKLGVAKSDLNSERKRSLFLEKFSVSISRPVLSGRKLVDGMRKWSSK